MNCPAAMPMEGAACDGIQGTMCTYGTMNCRCRTTQPIWTCAAPGSAGAGGRFGGFGGFGGGFPAGGRGGFAGRGGAAGRGP
jgi:hypothetical protein